MARNEPTAGAKVPRDVMEVIEAAVFVRATTMQALLRPVISEFAHELSADPAVQAALEARDMARRADTPESASVTNLPKRKP
jgi:hypothetical protein